MRVIKPSAEIVFYVPEDGTSILQGIEDAGRTCYKSEDKITATSASKFVRMLRQRGHHAMLEFGFARAKIVADRGLTHELVRHRLASFAQESTRYCNYSKDKFDSEITVIEIPGSTKPSDELLEHWRYHAEVCEKAYFKALELGAKPEIARMWLPIGLKTEIVIAANLREWMHIFELRCASTAHPVIRGVMLRILKQFTERMPEIYEDIANKYIPIQPGDVYMDYESATVGVIKGLQENSPWLVSIGILGEQVEGVRTILVSKLKEKWTRIKFSDLELPEEEL